MTLSVKSAGLYSTVQDLGRYGYLNKGVPSSGALDYKSHILVNNLLGNTHDAATVEMTYIGAKFKVESLTYIAVAGADMQFKMNGLDMPLGEVIAVNTGDEITFDKAVTGMRTYLGISGGFITEKYLKSSATHEKLAFGRHLQAGDLLKSNASYIPNQNVKLKQFNTDNIIRIIRGQQFDYFSDSEIVTLLSNEYKISMKSDRMGFRLDGERLFSEHGYDILSEPTLLGSIQIPADGKPIVLLNERQTIGGYPKVATVIKTDIPKLVQIQPGETFTFKLIELEEARELYIRLMNNLESEYYIKQYNPAREITSSRVSRLLGGE